MNVFERQATPGVAALGTYEPGRPIDDVARSLGFDDPSEIIKLASNENALGPSPAALAAMQAAAGEMHRYPDGGTYRLREAIAAKLDVAPAQVMPGNGSNELIELLGHVYMRPGSSMVMADHAFVVYRLVAACFGAEVVSVPMRALTHDLDAMTGAIRPDTNLLFVANPNNPTGTRVDPEAFDRLLDGIPDHVIVCIDEAYVELLPPDEQPDTLRYVRAERPVVLLRTFSKTYGLAGLRLGYAVAPEACIRLLNRVRQPFNVNAMAQAAAIAALDDEAHVEASRTMVREGLAYLERSMQAAGLETVPACVNFMLVKVGEGRRVFERLMKEGVIVRPMDGYGLPEYIRVTVGLPEENRRFVDALGRVLGLE